MAQIGDLFIEVTLWLYSMELLMKTFLGSAFWGNTASITRSLNVPENNNPVFCLKCNLCTSLGSEWFKVISKNYIQPVTSENI